MPRTCEENLALRAWASADARKTLAQQLLKQPIIRKLPARDMRKALKDGKPEAIAAALPALQTEVERCQRIANRVGPLQEAA